MKKKPRIFLRGEFPVVFAVLCAMMLRLAFYPESRTPIALYGTIIGAVLFVIIALVSYWSEMSESKEK